MAGADLEALNPEWGDDQRMRWETFVMTTKFSSRSVFFPNTFFTLYCCRVMLAPLRSRELNPESWEAKVRTVVSLLTIAKLSVRWVSELLLKFVEMPG